MFMKIYRNQIFMILLKFLYQVTRNFRESEIMTGAGYGRCQRDLKKKVSLAIKRGRTSTIRAAASLAAIAIFLYIVGVAMNHNPLSWLAGV